MSAITDAKDAFVCLSYALSFSIILILICKGSVNSVNTRTAVQCIRVLYRKLAKITRFRWCACTTVDPPVDAEFPIVKDIRTTCCTLTYQPPSDDGGAPLIGYILERRTPGQDSEWIRISDAPIADLHYTVDGLTPDTQYEFRVAAVNMMCMSEFSRASTRIVTVEVPSEPGCPQVIEVIGTTVHLQWRAPDNDGGTDITHYELMFRTESYTNYITVSTDANKEPLISHVLRSVLLANTGYKFAVAAVNRVGQGPWSIVSNDIPTFAGKL